QRTLLMRNHIHPPREILQRLKYAAQAALGAGSLTELMGIEGAGALAYFSHFSGMLKTPHQENVEETNIDRGAAGSRISQDDERLRKFAFIFNERNRRPPRDPVNALLSLGYS